MTDGMLKAMLGPHAVHTAFNYVVQGAEGEGKAAIIGNTTFAQQMSFGGVDKHPHTLVLCDVFIRPHLVVASPHLTGCGASGILTAGDGLASVKTWLQRGQVLINNLPRGGHG